LRETPEDGETNKEREMQILVAYALAGLFGSEGLCCRRWH
jgi:hypothetical protein